MTPQVEDALRAAVTEALGQGKVAAVRNVMQEPLEYDAFFAHRTVSRLRGSAMVNGAPVPWSLIEKRTEGPALAAPYLLDNGRREFDAYSSGVLENIAPGIRAPHLYGSLLEPDGGITLWLEEVHHDGSRPLDSKAILSAARDLGSLAGRWLGRQLDEPWYFREWIERHGQTGAVARGLETVRDANPGTVARLGRRLALTERLIVSQPRVREMLESLPHTLCHHDAVGANVFSTASGTVLIDWESVGPGSIGSDLASLLFSSVRRGDASIDTVSPILDDALRAYAEGLSAEGADVGLEQIRRGFDAAVALRWKLAVDVVAGVESGEAPRRGSVPTEPQETALHELIRLVDLLLDSAARALDWPAIN